MRIAIPGAAVAVLLSSTLALAQGPQDRPGRGGQDQGERAGPQRGGPGPGGASKGEMRQESAPRVQREQGERPRAAEREGVQRERTQSRAQQQQQEPRRDRADRQDRKEQKADRTERRTDQQKDRADRSNRRENRAEQKQDRREDRADRTRESGENRADRRGDGRDNRADRGDRNERRQAARQGRERLSQEQRTRFRGSFDRRHVTNVNIRVRIGTRFPRSVRLYPVPAVVVSLVPAYRYYSYVYVDDTICIVDPDTYEIVDVIEYSSGGPAVIEARLDLTDAERALILDAIAADFPEAEIDLRLALGADVPGRVELHRFPDVVLDRIPRIRSYRFLASDGDIVIVDPDSREIELVVRR